MIRNGTVPCWCKHGTIQPSQLNHPLLLPTTCGINVKQASESTFPQMQPFVLVLPSIDLQVSFTQRYMLPSAAERFILNAD